MSARNAVSEAVQVTEVSRDHAQQAALPMTARAVLLGGLLAAVVVVVHPHTAWIARSWYVGGGALLKGAIHVLLVLLVANSIVLALKPRLAFSRSELLIVYGMLMVSLGFAGAGGMPYLVSAVAYPFYMATPSNNWESMILPHVPDWIGFSQPELTAWFWQGSPKGAGVPWAAWSSSLLTWGSFTVALMAAQFCLAALLRRDWIERQRLSFPLVGVPLAMSGEQPGLGHTIFANRVFWVGFAVPASFAVLGWLQKVYPGVSAPNLMIEVGRNFRGMSLPWSVLGDMYLTISFAIVGIACLVPTEVSFSLWLFYVLYRVQLLIWAAFGIAGQGSTSMSSLNPQLFIGFQESGGFIALSAVLLYQSRRAFQAGWRALIGRGTDRPDVYAPLTERYALLGFVVANVLMLWWAFGIGMSLWSFALLVAVFYVLCIACSRLVAAAGVLWADSALRPRQLVVHALGARSLDPVSLTMYSYLSIIYMSDVAYLPMPQMMNSFKLLHIGRIRGKAFPWAAAVAVILVFAVGVPVLLKVLHTHGAATLSEYPFRSYAHSAFLELDSSLRTPEQPNPLLWGGMLIGGTVTLLLIFANTQLAWWPVSPVGYVMASSYFMNEQIWASALIGWLIVGLVRRYGGLRVDRMLRPAFLGLVLGEVLPGLPLAVLSAVFGVTEPLR